jgi:hypothetical protein
MIIYIYYASARCTAHIENDTPPTGTEHVLLYSDNEENDRVENAPKKKKRMHAAKETGKCLTTII